MRHAGRTRCPWCGARNYTIDFWCARCLHYLDWAPPSQRYHGGRAFLSALAAMLGVSLFTALPVAAWFNGSQPAVLLTLPKLPIAPHQPSLERQPDLAPAATPSAQRPEA